MFIQSIMIIQSQTDHKAPDVSGGGYHSVIDS